jgi:MoxR-like ATPase
LVTATFFLSTGDLTWDALLGYYQGRLSDPKDNTPHPPTGGGQQKQEIHAMSSNADQQNPTSDRAENGDVENTAQSSVENTVEDFAKRVNIIRQVLHQVVVGQDEVIDQLLICGLTGSHALLVGVPGLAKTLMIKALAAAFTWKYTRIQFTPDLMPADVTGYELLGRSQNGEGPEMVFRPGPVFANLVLADEINRAAPKTQSALLESMAEGQVTVGGETYRLEEPFMVAATQNPIEQEGTYPLPEAQLDRFMMEIHIGYPTTEQEEEIVTRTTAGVPELPEAALDRSEFLELRELVLAVPVPQNVTAAAVKICAASRPDNGSSENGSGNGKVDGFIADYVSWGAGPRGSQNLVLAAKARALLEGRTAPIIADIRAVAKPILRHRIIVNHRAVGDSISSEHVIDHLLKEIAV